MPLHQLVSVCSSASIHLRPVVVAEKTAPDSSSRRGFTLIELLVVIAIIGVLSGLLLPAIQAAREAARRSQCMNNLRQVGLALTNYESAYRRFPSGWSDYKQTYKPGWGWSLGILPFLEQGNLSNQIDTRFPIDHDINKPYLQTVIPNFLCPSDTGESTFMIGKDMGNPNEPAHVGHTIDEGDKLFRIAKSNYVGVFGTLEIDEVPFKGDGTFYGNSQTRLRELSDGLSNTIIVGERSSRLGGSVWHGWIENAAEPGARFLGTTDHTPNSRVGHFDDFSSYHTGGVHFIFGDCATRMISSDIDIAVYQSLATRAGGEPAAALD